MTALSLAATLLVTQSLNGNALPSPPSLDTSEWRFTGVSGHVVDRVFGPGLLEAGSDDTLQLDTYTTAFAEGIPGIGGQDVSVLAFQRFCSQSKGYTLKPFTQIGSGGAGVRAFTLVYDIYLDANNADDYQALLQTGGSNDNDAELHLDITGRGFYHNLNASGGGGFIGPGTWSLGTWNRFVYVNDFDADQAAVYVNGSLAFSDNAYSFMSNGDLGFRSWILADNSCNVSSGWLANFAVVDRVMTAQEIATLGGPHAEGIFNPGFAPSSYCAPAVNNSSGVPAVLTALGGWSPQGGTLLLRVTDAPPNQIGMFIASQTQGLIMNPGGSAGNLCLGGSIFRFNRPGELKVADAAGAFTIDVDLLDLPGPSGSVAVMSGDQWNFQTWFRDIEIVNGNPTATSNFTSAVSLTFD